MFGVDIQTPLSKADRVIYGESAMTHAMVFTAVSLDVSHFVWQNFHKKLFSNGNKFHRKMVNRPNSVSRIRGEKMLVKKVTS